MFKWLNERLAGTPNFKAAEALRVELEPLQKVQGASPNLIDRLIQFVFTGEDENAVAELAEKGTRERALFPCASS